MIETAVHITKRRYPSGKICYTVRWFQEGHYRGHACGPHKEVAYEDRHQKQWELKQGISDDICHVSWDKFVTEYVSVRATSAACAVSDGVARAPARRCPEDD